MDAVSRVEGGSALSLLFAAAMGDLAINWRVWEKNEPLGPPAMARGEGTGDRGEGCRGRALSWAGSLGSA